MTIILLLMIAMVLYKIKINLSGFYEDYMSKTQTSAINGIFIFIVFCSHIRGYILVNGALDYFCTALDQLMVTSFLFYSGYGCTVSYLNKGNKYLKHFMRNRFLTTLINFDIAVIFYIIIGALLKTQFSVKQIIGSFFALNSVGNSNWYIFVILCMYFIFYLSYTVFFKKTSIFNSLFMIIVLSVSLIKVLQYTHNGQIWWYSSALCFPAGVIFAYIKDSVFKVLSKSNLRYFSVLFALLFILIYTTPYRYSYSILFMFIVVLLSMKISVGNRILEFLGNHVFEIYVYQRIPMILLKYFNIAINRQYLFFFISFFLTIIIAVIMKKFYTLIDSKIKKN